MVFIVILLMLPQYSPVTTLSFNYAPIAVAVVVGGAGLWYAVSARKWFKGPKVQGTAEELAEIERDLSSEVASSESASRKARRALPAAPFSCPRGRLPGCGQHLSARFPAAFRGRGRSREHTAWAER